MIVLYISAGLVILTGIGMMIAASDDVEFVAAVAVIALAIAFLLTL